MALTCRFDVSTTYLRQQRPREKHTRTPASKKVTKALFFAFNRKYLETAGHGEVELGERARRCGERAKTKVDVVGCERNKGRHQHSIGISQLVGDLWGPRTKALRLGRNYLKCLVIIAPIAPGVYVITPLRPTL